MLYLFFIKKEDGWHLDMTTDSEKYKTKPLEIFKTCGTEKNMLKFCEYLLETVPNEDGVFGTWRQVMLGMCRYIKKTAV